MKYADYTDPDYGEGELHVSQYANNGNIALVSQSSNGEPWRKLTVNFDRLGHFQVALDRNNQGDKPIQILMAAGIIEHAEPDGHIKSGYVTYPVYSLSHEFRGWLGKVVKL